MATIIHDTEYSSVDLRKFVEANLPSQFELIDNAICHSARSDIRPVQNVCRILAPFCRAKYFTWQQLQICQIVFTVNNIHITHCDMFTEINLLDLMKISELPNTVTIHLRRSSQAERLVSFDDAPTINYYYD